MKKHRPRPRKPPKPRVRAAPAEPRREGLVYYHGGQPGLAVGSYILPRAESGSRANIGAEFLMAQEPVSMAAVHQAAAVIDQAAGHSEATDRTVRVLTPCDPTSVYVTTSLPLAAWYAARHHSGAGAVYAVAPEGELVPDLSTPDRTDIHKCDRARILATAKVPRDLMQTMRDRARRGFANHRDFEDFINMHSLGYTSAADKKITDSLDAAVAQLTASGCSSRSVAIGLLAAAIKAEKLFPAAEARALAMHGWVGVVNRLRQRAEQATAA